MSNKDDTSEGLGILIFLALAAYAIYLFVIYVLPVLLGIGAALFGGVAVVGLGRGVIVGFANFSRVLIEAHRQLP